MKSQDVYYYVTGGTLRPDAPSYVERLADAELADNLLQGEFCYVLTSRQMGKSSLMVRTVRRFREQGLAVAVLDLTAIGQNLTVEQWYEGLAERLGQQLDLDVEMEDYWLAHPRLSPVQRFFGAVRNVGMEKRSGRLVIFVDEIDSVRSLPFSTDEFFAAIRESYNRRAVDAEFSRLTFCLLGVATPADLIRDTRTTPFNIGRRIELTDFTPEEAKALAQGLTEGRTRPQADEILDRILYWTHGHPYLTQRLCKAVAENPAVTGRHDVDTLCEDLFLSERARERDDNLVFVRDRILRSETDRVSLLDLYLRVWQRRLVPDDPGNTMAGILRLAGIVRCESGHLVVRMRIYERVFDKKWVQSHMPDAELRRQKEAYHSGILRTAAVALLMIVIIGGLARYGFEQAEQARLSEASANFEHQRSEQARLQMASMLEQMEVRQAEDLFKGQRPGTALAYLAHAIHGNPSNRVAVTRLITAMSQRNFALPLLENTRLEIALPATGPTNRFFSVRGETVHILNENREPVTDQPLRHEGNVRDAQFSPDGQRVVTAGTDNTARIWDATTGLALAQPLRHGGPVWAARFSPGGQRIATLSLLDRTARIWDANSGLPLTEPMRVPGLMRDVEWSADGQTLVVKGQRSRLGWDVRPGGMLAVSLRHDNAVNSVKFSPDGRWVAVSSRDGTVRIWDTRTGIPISPPIIHERSVNLATFSPDGSMLATACDDSTARIWKLPAGEPALAVPLQHQREVKTVMFNSDGTRLATASLDGTARVWEVATGQPALPPLQHPREVLSATFSVDGKLMVTTARDDTIRAWDALTGDALGQPMRHEGHVFEIHFSPDQQRIVSASADGTARVWSVKTGEPFSEPLSHNGFVHAAKFSPDGKFIATASADRTARLWDAQTGQPVGTPLLHDASVIQTHFFQSGTRVMTTAMDRSINVWDSMSSQPLTETFQPVPGTRAGGNPFFESVQTTDLDPQGNWIASAGIDGSVQILKPIEPPLPAPEWLASLAEAVSGEKVNQRGLLESVDARSLIQIKQMLTRSTDDDFYTQWGQWFFADRSSRAISVGSGLTVAQYVSRKIEENRTTSLIEALRIEPSHPVALGRLARTRLDDAAVLSGRTQAEALFLSERALLLAPREPEIWQRRAEVLALTGNLTSAMEAVAEGMKISKIHPGLWHALGFVLERSSRLSEADAAYTRGLELAENAGLITVRDAIFQSRRALRQSMNTEPPGGATRD